MCGRCLGRRSRLSWICGCSSRILGGESGWCLWRGGRGGKGKGKGFDERKWGRGGGRLGCGGNGAVTGCRFSGVLA